MTGKCVNTNCPYCTGEPCEASGGCTGFEEELPKTCLTCDGYDRMEGVCCRPGSRYLAEFRRFTDTCEAWRKMR